MRIRQRTQQQRIYYAEIAELAPIPIANETTITAVSREFLRSIRKAYRRSWNKVCIIFPGYE
jgi:hypothetical protein